MDFVKVFLEKFCDQLLINFGTSLYVKRPDLFICGLQDFLYSTLAFKRLT